MRTLPFLLFFGLLTTIVSAQTITYAGLVGQYPIQLVVDGYEGKIHQAFYVYTKYDTPIPLEVHHEADKLTLIERDASDQITGQLTIAPYSASATGLKGTWVAGDGNKRLPLELQRLQQYDAHGATSFKSISLLQANSLPDRYFVEVLAKVGEAYAEVKHLHIYEKKTDKLLQSFELQCVYREFNSVLIGDYNFDGYPDFSVFESFYAGPNTSTLYFLYDPATDSFFESGFTGISLDFDPETKTVTEYDQCCAGRYISNTTYEIVNNKMVLIERHCLEYSESEDEMIEVDCE